MTRLGIISDIHGNLHALQEVMARLDQLKPDQVVCLGDIVGYGPFPAECLDLVTRRCRLAIRGNHDEAVLSPNLASDFNGAARAAVLWTRQRLTRPHLAAIRGLPAIVKPHVDVTCVHDSPVPAPTDYIHDHGMAALAFRGMDTPLCLLGHTHVPVVFEALAGAAPGAPVDPDDVVMYQLEDAVPIELDPANRYICNPGSVGQPRDYDPRASFAILDLAQRIFTVHRQEYDIDAAQAASQQAGLPSILAERLAVGV